MKNSTVRDPYNMRIFFRNYILDLDMLPSRNLTKQLLLILIIKIPISIHYRDENPTRMLCI